MEILEDTLHDTILMLPLLFLAYLVIEYFDRKDSQDDKVFLALQKYGPLVGALVGVIPQCGFSIIAAMLFMGKNITMGTLLAVFIATSDEAIPILLANPELYSSLLYIIIGKVVLAIVVGYFVDKILLRKQQLHLFADMEEEDIEEEEEIASESACPCCYTQYTMPVSALLRSIKIFAFLFLTTLILNVLIATIGEATLEKMLLTNSVFQPILAALFGFIPNCAASVVLTQLYVAHTVSFASLFAGLITNAGLGFIVLLRYQASKKEIVQIATILFLTAIIAGIIMSIVPLV
ncbi:MAG: hypothetical protein EOM50_06250 [Erysipelotrichia bacterium]|nr:hypothetical protein [Erysipelotrichia bacterium]NCC55372.1 hypothetical protein [Erysipelotrichia bacterium]